MLILSFIIAMNSEADVDHTDWTVLQINNYIRYFGDETLDAVPIYLLTPVENPKE